MIDCFDAFEINIQVKIKTYNLLQMSKLAYINKSGFFDVRYFNQTRLVQAVDKRNFDVVADAEFVDGY